MKMEKSIFRYYINKLAEEPFSKKNTGAFLEAIKGHTESVLGLNLEKELSDDEDDQENKRFRFRRGYRDFNNCDESRTLREGLEIVRNALKRRNIIDITQPGFDKNIDYLVALFGLKYEERCIVQLLINMENNRMFKRMISNILDDSDFPMCGQISIKDVNSISVVTGVKRSEIAKALRFDGSLIGSGLVRIDSDGELMINPNIARSMVMKLKSVDDLKNCLLGDEVKGDLSLDFFNVKEGYDYIKLLIQQAVKKNIKGMNVLVYGPTGTGKSEMVKQIVTSLGYHLYGLQSSNKHKEEKNVAMSYLLFAQRILSKDKNSVIVIDEAEDVFSYNQFSDSAVSKLFINQLLERNQRPVIWITNCINCMDKAYLRRFAYCLEFKKPDEDTKGKIWRNICVRHKLKLTDDEIKSYAKKYDVAPGVIDMAVRVAKLTKLPNAISNTIDSMCLAMTGKKPEKKEEKNGVDFDSKLLNTDFDMERLTDKLKNSKKRDFSLCLYGASGTGKSAYAKYLAEQMGIKAICKRASDLQSKYVGETEKNIAAAFEEAKSKNAMLIFDEADSFLRDRSRANQSWEVSCVNEMLTQMENSKVPFVCTTNLMQDLDTASLRRFIFKVKYDYMTNEQVKMAFQDFFNISVSDTEIRGLDKLAPGDFAVVKNKVDFLEMPEKDKIVDMLRAEMDAKNIRKGKKIGF